MTFPASLRTFSTLQITLAFSVLLHAVLLSVRFVAPEQFDRVFQDTPLEVILVNARTHEEPPEKAQAIAQHALAGGGEAAKGRATSPLPYSALTRVGNDFEDAQKKADALLEQQTQLLAQLRRQVAALPPPDPRKPS
ncbi:MAG: energy transducer TonB, partial [Giesbergeria sp.]